MLGLKKANKEDLILISDCDEIPNLQTITNTDLKKIKNSNFLHSSSIQFSMAGSSSRENQ